MEYQIIIWRPISLEKNAGAPGTRVDTFASLQMAQYSAALLSLFVKEGFEVGVYEIAPPGICHRFYRKGVCAYSKEA